MSPARDKYFTEETSEKSSQAKYPKNGKQNQIHPIHQLAPTRVGGTDR